MDLIFSLIFGLIAGAIAKFLYPNNRDISWPVTIILGLGGSFLGGWLGGLLGMSDGSRAGWIGSILGALILLFIYERVMNARSK